ncbi:putative acetolactate synthase [Macrophomina phaseolina]|uniref:Acetolactate synthase n=1 Tax=Macrophomina phaseolina TaxID=35725 RepID=A0ABQ8GSX5_9PEZI|nr:putative acetolactate synthase [Macrophomina phaseolina]
MAAQENTVADLVLESLALAGVDYLFTVLGSDHPSIIEAYSRRKQEGRVWPKLLIFLHEFVALSAADGFARLTKRPQCVIVHVDVGTAALGQGLHNASSGRAPVLIFAGQAPLTLHGELQGSRSEHVQWYQDIPNQHLLLAPYARFTAELKCAEHAHALTSRALRLAVAASPGPAYLTAAREVLAARTSLPLPTSPSLPLSCLGALPPNAVQAIGGALLAAQHPLIVTGYLGRSNAAVRALVELADLVSGVHVFDSEFREMSFPAGHRAWLARGTGAAAAIRRADVVVLLDVDVPWIPVKVRPGTEGARIFHVDADVVKERMGLFDVGAEGAWGAECAVAVAQVVAYVRERLEAEARREDWGARWEALGREHAEGWRLLDERAAPRADGRLSADYLFRSLRRLLPDDTVWVSDVVTNQVALSEQLRLDVPATNFTKGGSGLGWSGGAAIGMKLATQLYDTANERPCVNRRQEGAGGSARFVCSITGDGSFVFGAPSAVYWAQYQHKTPFLTVVVNNGGWKATRSCINDVHPDGLAAKTSDQGLGIDLRGGGPDYLGIAKAAAGGNLVTERVESVLALEEAVVRLVREVQECKIGAVLEAIVV